MEPLVRIGGFGLVLAAVFGAAYGTGAAVGPADRTAAAVQGQAHREHGSVVGGQPDAVPEPAPTMPPSAGLVVSQNGYTLQAATGAWPAGRTDHFTFRILGPDGRPVTDFVRSHDADLHLVVVRRDLSGYQHLHPTRDAEGLWSVPLALAGPGSYRVFADFTPAATPDARLTLGTDLSVAGTFAPIPLPASARTATTDGYNISLTGDPRPGMASGLTFSVSRGGRPVTDLEPYLGAYGHLVALREGDLAYLHVHPDGEAGDADVKPGPDLAFTAEIPSTGSYYTVNQNSFR